MNFQKLFFITLFSVAVLYSFGQQKASQADINASKLISLSNAVIDISNAYSGKYQYYDNTLNDGREKYEQLQKSYDPRFSVNFNGSGSFPIAAGFKIKYENALKDVPSSMPEKASIEAAVKSAHDYTALLEKWGKDMRNYFVNKEFEKDQFANYPTLNDSLAYYLTQTKNAWKNAVRVAGDAGDIAEMQLLKKSPIAQFLIPMKTDLQAFDKIMDDFSEQLELDDPDFSPVKKEIAALQESVNKNKSTDGKNTSVLSHEVYYTTFFEKVSKCSSTLLSLIEELSKNAPDERTLDLLFNNLEVHYNEVINSYNNFAEYGAK